MELLAPQKNPSTHGMDTRATSGRDAELKPKSRFFRSLKRACRVFVVCLLAFLAACFYIIYRAYSLPMLNVTINVKARALPGYNLFAPTVDDVGAPLETPNSIYLVDMDGTIVHSWRVLGSVQLAKLKPDGNLLYTTRDRSFRERAGLRELDPFGNVLWYYQIWADHDFFLLENGNILIHYIEDKEVPAIGEGLVRSPQIVEVTPQKEVVWEWRGEDHLTELTDLVGIEFPLEKKNDKPFIDWAHSNNCQVIGENPIALKDSRFRSGNILFSYPNLNVIGVIDKDSGQIVWAWGPGILDGQHNPTMMDNGNLLIFDNGTERGYSRILEVNPLSEEIVWEYNDRHSQNPRFYSRYISGAQALANSNIFVCQGNYVPDSPISFYRRVRERISGEKVIFSRLFEVTREKEVVWECIVHMHGNDTHNIYQATRYFKAYLMPLFERLKEHVAGDKTKELRSLPYTR